MIWLIRTITLLWSLALTCGDDTVICLFSTNCVLPCQSSFHDVIHWQKWNNMNFVNVHSFYKGTDQRDYQNPDYRGRTSLFKDQLSKGNISLTLSGLRVQDEGRYKCYTSVTSENREAFVNVIVKAPIKSVDIKMTDDGIVCNTSEVYPKPTVSWNNNVTSPDYKIAVDSHGLFSLSSTFPAQLVQSGLTYICSISLKDGSQTYSANLTKDERMEIMERKESSTPWWVPAVVVIVLLAVIAAFIVGVLKLKDKLLPSCNAGQPRDSHQLNVTVTDGEVISEGSPLAAEAHMKQKLEDTL